MLPIKLVCYKLRKLFEEGLAGYRPDVLMTTGLRLKLQAVFCIRQKKP